MPNRTHPAGLTLVAFVVVSLVVAATGCSDVTSADPVSSDTAVSAPTTPGTLPSFFARFAGRVQVAQDGDFVVLRTDDLPPHPSPYYPAGNPLHTAATPGMVLNPNRIQAQAFELRVPAQPRANVNGTSTGGGAIGVAVNGVVLFNQYAAGNSPLDAEFRTFDVYNGHPQQTGAYHYHLEPVDVTHSDPGALVGVLLDGFPVYGTVEYDGRAVSGLDDCNGHVGVTRDHPQGIYHYHVTAAFPYINGCYRGTPGRGSN